jgi:hypothetical protein
MSAADQDTCDFDWNQALLYGYILQGVCSRSVVNADPVKRQEILDALGEGRYSWMFDADGNFISHVSEREHFGDGR